MAAHIKIRKRQRRIGLTLVELLVVSTILVMIASLTLPVSQIIRQREKENRLRDILRLVRDQGIGLGAQMDGYANYVETQINRSSLTPASQSYTLASASFHGLLYPRNPSALENPQGQAVQFPTDNSGSFLVLTIPRRFVRKIPPHPFTDWFPGCRWEFKAVATAPTAGLGTTIWFASSTGAPWNQAPPTATGVIDIRSRGAGLSLDGTNTDDW